jgi:hypothetical protein
LVAVKIGPVLVGGINATEPGRYHWFIRTTSDSGASWGLSDDHRGAYSAAGVNALASNGVATYAIGYEFMDYQYKWQVRKLSGGLWTLVDDWTTGPGYPFGAMPKAGVVLPSGTVLVAGTYGAVPGGAPYWVVRRSADGGASWSLTDQRLDCKPKALASNKSGSEVLIAGQCPFDGVDKWVVLVSHDEGLTWQQDDVFALTSSNSSSATGATFDEQYGYVVGGCILGNDASLDHAQTRVLGTCNRSGLAAGAELVRDGAFEGGEVIERVLRRRSQV